MTLDQTSDFTCVSCGAANAQVIRKDPTGENHRLKCRSCGFMFNSNDSQAALEAGVIQPSSPEALAGATEPERVQYERPSSKTNLGNNTIDVLYDGDVPLRPAYVFLSKPRGSVRFCSKRDFKRVAVTWHDRPHDLYELKPLKISVKVDVS